MEYRPVDSKGENLFYILQFGHRAKERWKFKSPTESGECIDFIDGMNIL
jgi:hypothetical protein